MRDIVVLCPTRDRPDKAAEMVASLWATAQMESTKAILVVDDDDPKVGDYIQIRDRFPFLDVLVLPIYETGNLTLATNSAAKRIWDRDIVIGHVGDDHRFRTAGWDKTFSAVLDEHGGGMVAGDDGNRVDGDVPTQIFMSAEIPRALGWYALPVCNHLYIDNAWAMIGRAVDAFYYVPGVVIDHLHPAFGKADWDEGYRKANTKEAFNRDAAAFSTWARLVAPREIELVRTALGR